MKNIPETLSIVLRTDFSDESAWQSLSAALWEATGGFKVRLEIVSDLSFSGLSAEELAALPEDRIGRYFVFVADSMALAGPETSMLVLDLNRERGRTFRTTLSEVGNIADNLSLGNMDFEEFADAVNDDGIFRGFPQSPVPPPPRPKQSFWKKMFG